MHTEVHHGGFGEVVDPTTEVSVTATGFTFTEGPVWHPDDHFLIFSDMPGDHMRRWSADRGITTFRRPSNMANGNAYDRQGRLVTCEHKTSRVVRTEHDGSITVLASHYEGFELNSPNDVIVRSDGTIFFTDPVFGRRVPFGVAREPEMDVRGVYAIRPDGTLLRLVDDFDQPNGLCLSLDEGRLFVNDTPRRHIRVFDVAQDASLRGGEIWAELGGSGTERTPDGMKMDSAGNVFCGGPRGVHIFDPEGIRLGVVLIPENVSNFAWGGADLRTVFVTACTTLYSFRVEVPGLPQFGR